MLRSILVALLFSSLIILNAQIVYVDIPDTTYSATTSSVIHHIDINQDGTEDMGIEMISDLAATPPGVTGAASFVASTSPQSGMIKDGSWGDAIKFNYGDSIGANSTGVGVWSDFSSEVPVIIYVQGNNYGQQWNGDILDGYLGIKIEVSGAVHYGWIRMDVVDGVVDLKVKDWAYNSVADQAIMIGDTGTVDPVDPPDTTSFVQEGPYIDRMKFYPNPSNGELRFQKNLGNDFILSIFDLKGTLIRSIVIEDQSSFNISDLDKGVYIVELKSKEYSYIEKLVLQ